VAYEQKDNSGSLFKNDKKTEEKHPNARGSAMVGGVEYWVSAWTKKDKNGNPWQSLAFTKKEPKAEEQTPKSSPTSAGKRDGGVLGMDDDVPF
jgi:hypothetical protein